MLKYFYYVWNLLKNDERLNLFYHFGQCILAAILYTITDWQYLFLLLSVAYSGSQSLTYSLLGIQFFALIIGFWYYFIKYKIMSSQNYFYKLLSSRHYEYILKRIAENASFSWINEKSSVDLTKQLDATEKGLQYMFTFFTQFVRLVSTIMLSICVISINYKICFFIFGAVFACVYYMWKNSLYFTGRKRFQQINKENSLIISDNISLLFDTVVSGNYDKVINNIIEFNNHTKKDQIKMYSDENRLYIQIGLLLLIGYIVVLMVTSFWIGLELMEFTLFFIAALLTYKCINHNVNELCDMYANIRQTEIDFDSLKDIWRATQYKRPQHSCLQLPCHDIKFKTLKNYNQFRFNKIGMKEIDHYTDYFNKKHLNAEFTAYCDGIDINSKEMLLYMMKKFLLDRKKYRTVSNINSIHDESRLYKTFCSSKNFEIPKNRIFKIIMNKLRYTYPGGEFTIKFKQNKPIVFNSNSHIVIKGSSGSGKSTLLKIIRGVIPVIDGKNGNSLKLSIKVGNEIFSGISWLNLANSVSYCQQNSYSFTSGTIYQMLSDDYTSKVKDHTQSLMMKRALNISCVDHQFKNLDYKCSKDTISGGQKQRLIIAKSIYQTLQNNKQIIILDEVDTGLDIHVAKKIIINLAILFKNRMLIIVLHTPELQKLFKHHITLRNGIITSSI